MTVAILLTGCSIPLDEEPRELSMNLPDALLPKASTTTKAPTPNETVKIFLAKTSEDGEMKLEPVDREISSDDDSCPSFSRPISEQKRS